VAAAANGLLAAAGVSLDEVTAAVTASVDGTPKPTPAGRRCGMSAEDEPRLLTTGEVAAMFRVDAKSVSRWGTSGWLLSLRTLGDRGDRRYFAAEVDALLAGKPKELARELARELGLADQARLTGGAP
jgi:hypothetical protein